MGKVLVLIGRLLVSIRQYSFVRGGNRRGSKVELISDKEFPIS